MPCNSDHMNQTPKEKYYQETAQALVYLYESLHETVSKKLRIAEGEYYCHADYTAELCDRMTHLLVQSPTKFKRIVFDGSKKPARLLADWWEKHQEADKARIKKEREKRKLKAKVSAKEKELQAALAKLTPRERKLLQGVPWP